MPKQQAPLVVAIAALMLAATSVQAGGGHHGRHHHHHWRSGVSIGVGVGPHWPGYGWPGYYGAHPGWHPGPVIVERPVPHEPPVADAPPSAPDPVFVPDRGQGAAQTEADRRACNRTTMAQPEAMRDAQVFHRQALACMAGRGYRIE